MTTACGATAAATATRRERRERVRTSHWSVVLLAGGLLVMRGWTQRPVPVQEYLPSAFLSVKDIPSLFLGPREVKVLKTVETLLPGAMTGREVMRRALWALQPHGVYKDNTIYGQSVCSDEINGDRGHLTTLMTQYYGRVFNLGGIGGLPYVGETGFGAFSHHVADNGNVLIVFGPHIGFSMDGEAGKFLRRGQASCSTACGAVIAAYNQVMGGGYYVNHDKQDLQQCRLRHLLKPSCREVADDSHPMVALVRKAYKAVEQEMLAIVNTNFGPGKLVLLGGIQINMPHPLPGMFLPLHFTVRSKTEAPMDLLKPTFQEIPAHLGAVAFPWNPVASLSLPPTSTIAAVAAGAAAAAAVAAATAIPLAPVAEAAANFTARAPCTF